MRHPIAKITKLVRDLARTAYDSRGFLKEEFEDENGHGAFRSVLIQDGVAIKLARNDYYNKHNQREWDTYKTLPKSVQRITAKPLAISACGKVMAVELISGGTVGEVAADDYYRHRDEINKFNSNLKTLLKEAGFSHDQISSLLADNHANNIAYRDNGEMCWIDYAAYA